MGTRDPRIDAYIAKSAEFAQPILTHLREIVHSACPECQETLKWGSPHFMYKGMLCGMAAFKAHCAFGFWKGSLVVPGSREAMGQFGRIAKVGDLPKDKVLLGYVKKAVKLNDEGIKVKRVPKQPKAEIAMPADLAAALKKNAKARSTFDGFSPSHKREYLAWITGAKAEATRERRLGTAIEYMSAGKSLNWKYQR